MGVLVKTFSYHDKDIPIIDEIEKMSHREGYRGFSTFLVDILEKYVKEHKNGNPAYTLTQFCEDNNILAYPAFMSKMENWQNWLKKASNKDKSIMKDQIVKLDKALIQSL